jgi:hypothetical protein
VEGGTAGVARTNRKYFNTAVTFLPATLYPSMRGILAIATLPVGAVSFREWGQAGERSDAVVCVFLLYGPFFRIEGSNALESNPHSTDY